MSFAVYLVAMAQIVAGRMPADSTATSTSTFGRIIEHVRTAVAFATPRRRAPARKSREEVQWTQGLDEITLELQAKTAYGAT